MKKLLVLLLTIFALNSCEEDTTIIDATADKKLPKVDVCHYDADTDTWKSISVNRNALKAHLAHGDYVGECCDLTYVPDDVFEKELISMGLDEGPLDDYVKTCNIINIKSLEIQGSKTPWYPWIVIEDLTGIEDFESLEILHCERNILKSLDLSGNKMLKEVYCYENELTSLNVTKNQELEAIFASGNKLISLDVSNNLKLVDLHIGNNVFSKIDISKNINLSRLWIQVNNFSDIDLSNNLEINTFNCDNNPLVSIDVSKNIDLETFIIHSTPLSFIDVSNNFKLKNFHCYLSPNLESVNLKNGSNELLIGSEFRSELSPKLSCIMVDNPANANSGLFPYTNWGIDSWTSYFDNCP